MSKQAQPAVGSGQVVLDGVAGRRTARGDRDLAKDRGQVGVDGAGTDHELLGYLLICQPLCYQAQHLHLPCGQSIGIGWGFGNGWNRCSIK